MLNSKYQPPGSVLGTFTAQSPLWRTSLESIQSAALIMRGSLRGTPASPSAKTACAVSHTGETQGCMRKVGSGISGVGRLLDAQLLEFVAGADDLRIVLGVAQAAQRDDGVEHGRIDGAQAVGHLQALQHPLFRALERQLAQRADVNGLRPVHDPVENDEEIAPGEERLAVHAQAQDRSWRGRRRTARRFPAPGGIFLNGFLA